MRKQKICRLIDNAFNWSSDKKGAGLALYQFASTRMVHSEEHRAELVRDLISNIKWQGSQRPATRGEAIKPGNLTAKGIAREIVALVELQTLIEQAKAGEELITFERMNAYWKGQN